MEGLKGMSNESKESGGFQSQSVCNDLHESKGRTAANIEDLPTATAATTIETSISKRFTRSTLSTRRTVNKNSNAVNTHSLLQTPYQ